eukprot:2042324-Rhodomonas_salina.2
MARMLVAHTACTSEYCKEGQPQCPLCLEVAVNAQYNGGRWNFFQPRTANGSLMTNTFCENNTFCVSHKHTYMCMQCFHNVCRTNPKCPFDRTHLEGYTMNGKRMSQEVRRLVLQQDLAATRKEIGVDGIRERHQELIEREMEKALERSKNASAARTSPPPQGPGTRQASQRPRS